MSTLSESPEVVVTGGAGFIGSHLVEHLLEQGKNVTVIDNFESGRYENLDAIRESERFRIVEADVTKKDELKGLFQHGACIVHLAGLADIVPSIQQPHRYYDVNVTGTLNVLQEAVQNDCKKFVYAASSTCYGIPDSFPTSEDHPIRPQYPYALTKHMGEQLVMHWSMVYGLNAISLRLFNVYGPRVRTNGTYGAVLGIFMSQKANGSPLTVVGDGEQSRDFTHVRDVASAFAMSIDTPDAGHILNVGSGTHRSVNDLANLIGGEKIYLPKRPGEPDITFADISRVADLLNWKPKISLETGVAELLNSVQDWKSAPLWDRESIAEATSDWFKLLGSKHD